MVGNNGFQNGYEYMNNKNKDIKKMVFVKVAGQQGTGRTPKEIIEFAKQLQEEFEKW